MLLRKFSIAAAATLFIPLAGQVTHAATFTTQEVNEVHNFQKEYANLDKTSYSAANIYAKKPNLSKKFKVGRLDPKYIKTQTDYINYYRSLFSLPAISSTDTLNKNAQITAAVMAA
ncbi:CAP domain-containing protein, partial [Lactobacillus crispatus]